MKYKKYILLLLLTLVIGINKTYAVDADCYYVTNGFAAKYNISKQTVYVDKASSKLDDNDTENIKNFNTSYKINEWTISAYTNTNSCPKYLILENDRCPFFLFCIGNTYEIYATDSKSEAEKAIDDIGHQNKTYGFYAEVKPSSMTEEEYYKARNESVFKPSAGYGGKVETLDCDSLFGDKNDAGEWHYEEYENGEKKKIVDRPASISYLVNQVLTYVRIIVPIIIILLGSLDFAKAVVVGKEDEIKKIQKQFIIRIVAGVLVFFAPAIVNIIMKLADIVWEGLGYSSCGI